MDQELEQLELIPQLIGRKAYWVDLRQVLLAEEALRCDEFVMEDGHFNIVHNLQLLSKSRTFLSLSFYFLHHAFSSKTWI